MLQPGALTDRTARGIAGEISRLVAVGALAPGERLPTVRQIAGELGVSAGTVSTAWQALAQAGVIVSRGRAGTFVRGEHRGWLSPRVQGLAPATRHPRVDLSLGTPDPALLPSLEAAFARMAPRADAGRYRDLAVLPDLEEHLRATWPYTSVETLTIVDGALDGIGRVLEQQVRFGDRVAVESPGFPHFLDLLDALGAEPVPLELDRDGVVPASLAHALGRRPVAVLLQPRAQNPTGVSMSWERARALVRVLQTVPGGDRALVVEDDHSALISSTPDVTLGRWLPGQVVHVRGFSKSHGPDLRIAAMAGPARVVERVVARRVLGSGWTSRILQSLLLDLLTDDGAVARVRTARLVYRDRLDRMAVALRREGIDVGDPDGVNLWVPVTDERAALVRLAAVGIVAAAGAPFCADDECGAHLRVTAGAAAENIPVIADAIVDAARATG